MKKYSKPRLKVGEAAHLLYGEDFEKVSILDFNNVEVWRGTIRDLRTKEDPKLDDIRECLVRQMTEDCFKEKLILLEESENSSLRTINDFPKKDIYVVDLLHYLTEHDQVIIMEISGDYLWNGRVEDLVWTKDGCLHDLAMRQVNWFEAVRDCKLSIYLEPEDKPANSPVDHHLSSRKTYLSAVNRCRFCKNWTGKDTDPAATCSEMKVLKSGDQPAWECPCFKQDPERVNAWVDEVNEG